MKSVRSGVPLVEIAFLVVIALVPFMHPAPAIVVAELRVLPVDVAAVVAFGVWIYALIRRRVTLDGPFTAAVAVYVAGLVAVAIARGDLSEQMPLLAAEVYLPALALLAASVVRDEAALRRVVLVWLASTAVVVGAGLFAIAAFYLVGPDADLGGLIAHYGTLPPGPYPRISSLALGVTYLASYLSVGLLLVLAACDRGWLTRRLAIGLSVVIGVVSLATFSPLIGWIPLGVVLWWKLSERSTPTYMIAAASVAAAAFLLASVPSPTMWVDDEATTGFQPSSRALAWVDGVRSAQEEPWFGHGFGARSVDVDYLDASGRTQNLRDPHNGWLNLIVQKGVIGLAAFSGIALVVLRRPRWRRGDPVVIALGLSIAGLLVYQFLLSSLEQARHAWILIGLLAAFPALTTEIGRQEA